MSWDAMLAHEASLFELVDQSSEIRCYVERDEFGCSLAAGHDGVHRGHVSHDLSRAYVVIDPNHANGSEA